MFNAKLSIKILNLFLEIPNPKKKNILQLITFKISNIFKVI